MTNRHSSGHFDSKQLYSKNAIDFVSQIIDLQNVFWEKDKDREVVNVDYVNSLLNSGRDAESKARANEVMDQINGNLRAFLSSCLTSLKTTSTTAFYDLISLSRPVAARYFSATSHFNINIPFNALLQLSHYLECSISYLYFKTELKTPLLAKYQVLLRYCNSLSSNRVQEITEIINQRNPDLDVISDNDLVRRRISMRIQEYSENIAVPYVDLLKNCAIAPTFHILHNSITSGFYTGRTTPFLATCLSLKISPDFFIAPRYSSLLPKGILIGKSYSRIRVCENKLIDALTQYMDVNACNQLIADIIAGKL